MSRALPRLALARAVLLPLLPLLPLLLWSCALPQIVIHDDPLSAREHMKLGMAYEAKGEAARAEGEYRLAARHEPLARLYLGNLLYGQGRPDDAEGEYRTALKALPDNPEALNNLAWLLHERGKNTDEAEALAARAVELAPARPAFLDTLRAIRAARGR